MAPPAVEAIGLGRDYGATRALDALDLTVDAGTLVGLLGPNGAGKTTTMLLLATLLSPSRGTALVFGHDVTRYRAAVRRRLGLVFQETSIDPLLTVEENLLFAARLSGLGGLAARRAVADALETAGLAGRASQPARQLSTGWRRLADLARALLHRPDLLILDEPTVGLDPEHRERAWRLLEAVRRERGTAVLFSTHYLAEADPCDRVVMLAGGRRVASDTPAALKGSVGEEVLELEGADAPRVVSALQASVDVQLVIETEAGYRVGFRGPYDGQATDGTRLVRFVRRPVTLDDVYFARTLGIEPVRAYQKEAAEVAL